jgi:hypothetical protein
MGTLHRHDGMCFDMYNIYAVQASHCMQIIKSINRLHAWSRLRSLVICSHSFIMSLVQLCSMAISCDAFLESFSTEVPRPRLLKALEQLLQLRIRILGVLYHMSNRPLITINLPIIPARIRLIAKEVNLIIHHATPALLVRNMLETVRLVPARGEHVKGDLSADGVCEAEVGEGFFERGDHGGADVVLDVVGLVVVALLD